MHRGALGAASRSTSSPPATSGPRRPIYRVVAEVRYERIQAMPLDHIPNDRFKRRGRRRGLPGPDARSGEADACGPPTGRPAGLPGEPVRGPAAHPRAGGAPVPQVQLPEVQGGEAPRESLDPKRPSTSVMDEIEALYDQAVEVKNHLSRANLRLVVSLAKKRMTPGHSFFELVSDGNVSLMKAIEKFDFARGNKFSTYATWAIVKNYARTIPGEYKHQDRFRTSTTSCSTATEEHRAQTRRLREAAQSKIGSEKIRKILRRLDDREQQIVISRFGLDHSPRAADAQGGRRGDGRHQGAGPPDRGPRADQAPQGGRGRAGRAGALNRIRTPIGGRSDWAGERQVMHAVISRRFPRRLPPRVGL